MITALTIWVIGWNYALGFYCEKVHTIVKSGCEEERPNIFFVMIILFFVWPHFLGSFHE